ncbi:MAG TPA: HlyD family efflux transporter periplasmic adaptor subunit [Phycisphaerales bacterium]|nr:HlyD family efflux transporter periplasmic adaptor subunit [Phycisphaerales bacterium]
MFFRKYVVPALALAGLAVAIQTVRTSNSPHPYALPVSAPSTSPYKHTIAGSGIVESSTRNIEIGTNVAGIVTKVHVKVGDPIKAGDPLFMIDDRTLQSELAVKSAALDVARQNLARLAALPRAEDIPPAEARVAEMESNLGDMKHQLERMQSVDDPRAVSAEDLEKRRYAVQSAQARFDQAKADLAELRAGVWAPDQEIARAQVESAQAQVDATKTEIDRLTVRSPIDGQALQVNIRVGEFAPVGDLATPLMLVGNTAILHVRVDIDENDAWRLKPDARARATIRGNSNLSVDLAFAYLEPYVIPKRSLTGDSTERVDTRVLQVIYSFPSGAIPVYVGQQMDVFIESDAIPAVDITKTNIAKDQTGAQS